MVLRTTMVLYTMHTIYVPMNHGVMYHHGAIYCILSIYICIMATYRDVMYHGAINHSTMNHSDMNHSVMYHAVSYLYSVVQRASSECIMPKISQYIYLGVMNNDTYHFDLAVRNTMGNRTKHPTLRCHGAKVILFRSI